MDIIGLQRKVPRLRQPDEGDRRLGAACAGRYAPLGPGPAETQDRGRGTLCGRAGMSPMATTGWTARVGSLEELCDFRLWMV